MLKEYTPCKKQKYDCEFQFYKYGYGQEEIFFSCVHVSKSKINVLNSTNLYFLLCEVDITRKVFLEEIVRNVKWTCENF